MDLFGEIKQELPVVVLAFFNEPVLLEYLKQDRLSRLKCLGVVLTRQLGDLFIQSLNELSERIDLVIGLLKLLGKGEPHGFDYLLSGMKQIGNMQTLKAIRCKLD